MSNFVPGVIAITICSPENPDHVGKCLEITSHPYWDSGLIPGLDEPVKGLYVDVEAEWLPPTEEGWHARISHLLPITPPPLADLRLKETPLEQ